MSEIFKNMDGDLMARDIVLSSETHRWHKAGWDDAIRETKFLVELLEEISKAEEDHECYGEACSCHYIFPGQAKDALSKYRKLVEPK